VNRMADAVSRPAVPEAESLAGAAQKQVIIGIFKIGLQQIVVDILRRKFGFDARNCCMASNSSITMVPVASWVRV